MINLNSIILTFIASITLINAQDVKDSISSPLETITNCIRRYHADAQTAAPGSTEYNALNYQWNLYKPITPLGYFEPADIQQIQTVVKCSAETKVPIVVRGGGHSYEKYCYGSGAELVIDLQKHNKITVYQQNQIAEIQAGALLGKVYYQLNKQGGFGLPAGTGLTMGISGHILGGGYGISSRKHGLAVDTVTEIGIVTPDAKFLIASESQNSDLFWALRGGGGGQFGIVTHFKVKVFKPSKLATVLNIQYNKVDFVDAFNGFQNWVATNPDPAVTAIVYTTKNTFSFSAVIQSDNAGQNKTILDQINAHLPLKRKGESIRTMNHWDLMKDFGRLSFSTDEKYDNIKHADMSTLFLHAKSGYVDRKLSKSEITKWVNTLNQSPDSYFILLDAQGGAINNLARGATAFVHREKPLYSVQFVNEAPTLQEGLANEGWADYWTQQVGYLMNGEAYQNYIDARETSLTAYYGENLPRLRKVKAKYDPQNMFSFAQSVTAII